MKSSVPGAIVMDSPTAFKDASSYNNFYEFGTDKSDPARNAHTLKTRPWTVTVEGEVKKLAGTNHTTRPVVLICRSGNRSQEAGEELERAGFTRVCNVLHGFEGELNDKHQRNTLAGWRFEGLPWEQC